MRPLDQDLQVWATARRMGAGRGDGAVDAILSFCRDRVAGWASRAGNIVGIQDLERLVCSQLNLQFHEFRCEAALEGIVRRHVAAGEVVFASLPSLFDDDTFATLIRCRQAAPESSPKYVAVVDCRGGKASRRWFSRWHEIAHLLAFDMPTEAQPLHRSTSEHSAIERLMDLIAADIGFFDPLFAPAFSAEVLCPGELSFTAIERVRQRYAPEASFQATTIACLKRWPKPVLYLEAGLALTRAEAREFDQEPVPARRPTPKLRLLRVVPNAPARDAGFCLGRNMQVPENSILHRIFFARELNFPAAGTCAVEDLDQWPRLNGRRARSCRVEIEARPGRHYVEALAQVI